MPEEERRTGIGEGIRTGIGVLNALREAVEDTLAEAVERGDLSAERAREVLRDVVRQAGAAAEGVRERVEPAWRGESPGLREELVELRARVEALERTAGLRGPPPLLPPPDDEA
jgi:polyhydroxyalkanoate synthesis regulator phasin